jgi:metal-responsive CopG/Arc/MetJ family transcriptional regulator
MFGSKKSIKLDKSLYDRLADAAGRQGYSSAEELIVHLCEREVASLDEKLEQEQVERQLRGLGYIE